MLILRSLHLFEGTRRYHRDYRTYTGIAELIIIRKYLSVRPNLYWYFVSYTCTRKYILVLRNLYLSYKSYTCITKLVLVFQILVMCEGTRKYDKSAQIRLIQIYVRYGHWSIAGTDHNIYIYLFYRYESTRGYYRTYTYFTDTRAPLGTTGLILVLPIREYP